MHRYIGVIFIKGVEMNRVNKEQILLIFKQSLDSRRRGETLCYDAFFRNEKLKLLADNFSSIDRVILIHES